MRKLLLLLLIGQIWIIPTDLQAKFSSVNNLTLDKVVTGTINDANGIPIPGANVRVKGTNTGATANENGKYSVSVPDDNATLVYSYIGYITQEIVVGTKTTINVKLVEQKNLMDEVVVIGYGTQKKVNLTGSVASINIDEKVSNRTFSNVSSALSGLAPGLAVQQSTGLAGASGAKLLIRGLSSPNSSTNTSPLVVVDGIPDVDIDRLDMNDIENISILKDAASASVYGSRGATGVILITTKTGKGLKKPKISYTGTTAISNPTNFYHILDDYAMALTLHQRAARNGRVAPYFYDGTIDEWLSQSMVDPVKFPNENQLDYIMKDGRMQSHNISAAGANENGNYFLSVGAYDEKGILINNDANRYNFRFNGDYKIRKNVSVGIRTTGQWTNQTYGLANGFLDYSNTNAPLVFAISGILPYNYATQQYGGAMAYGEAPNTPNLYAEINARHNSVQRQELNSGIYTAWTPIEGLTARIDYALNYYNQFNKSYTDLGVNLYNFQTGGSVFELYPATSSLGNSSYQGFKTLTQAKIDYKKEIFKGHQLGLLAVASEEHWLDRGFGVSVGGRLDEKITEIGGNSSNTEDPSISGSSSEEGLRSFIGRFNYSVNEKYLFEASFRADGSSKFSPGNQWGYFPSVSAGWRFSQEKFFSSLSNIVSSGKLRASYGSLGNNSGVSRYEQLNTFISTPYVLNNNNLSPGISVNKDINEDFTWETTTVANIGLDLGFFNNQLTAEIDVYDRLTTDLIRPSSLSTLLSGLSAPRVNIGSFRNQGIELNLGWKSKINNIDYGATFNYSYNIDRLESWNQKLNFSKNFIDMPWFFEYHLMTSGIAQTWNDIYEAPYNTNVNIAPGDLLYKDLNGNGQIDSYDKKAFPKTNEQRPTSNYAANLFAAYKGFDISVLLQASTGRKDYFLEDMTNVNIGTQRYAFQDLYLTDIWTLDNRNSVLPRIASGSTIGSNRSESDFWIQSMDYLRLKNIQLGYNVPAKYLKKLGIERIKIYGTAENLFTITKWKGVDPEKSTLGNGFQSLNDDPFPILKSISFGLNIGL